MARVFSGIQPSGELHVGNYLGAVQNWVRLQHEHDCLFCIVDLHAITQAYDPAELPQRTIDMAIGLLAAGIDPAKAIVFVQSHVAEHSELNWLLTAVAPLGELERQTQYKDKSQRQESVPAGLLNYPVLQSADVLLATGGTAPDVVLEDPSGSDADRLAEVKRELADVRKRFTEAKTTDEKTSLQQRMLELMQEQTKLEGGGGGDTGGDK